jgi:hypothetical protein
MMIPNNTPRLDASSNSSKSGTVSGKWAHSTTKPCNFNFFSTDSAYTLEITDHIINVIHQEFSSISISIIPKLNL